MIAIPGLHLTPIGSGEILLEPLKSLNIAEQEQLIVRIARYLIDHRAAYIYYDLSTLNLIDPVYYAWLDALARATYALNVQMICVNMQPTAAFALSQFLQKQPVFKTALTIQSWRDANCLSF